MAEFEAEEEAADWMRRVLLSGPYPDLGASHPDLYKAFSWRFWQLCRASGAIGVVLPRSALSSAGQASWRNAIFDNGTFTDATFTTNTGGWVFDDAEPRYTVAFVSIRKARENDAVVSVRGPYASLAAYARGMAEPPLCFPADQFRTWTTGAAFPLIPTSRAGEIFVKMRNHSSLKDLPDVRFRPVQGDFNSTLGKRYMELSPKKTTGLWPVYKGASYYLWQPDTGEYYAWMSPKVAVETLQARRLYISTGSDGATPSAGQASQRMQRGLPCLNPRISYRRIARATDTRTIIACLVPPEVVLTDKAAYLLRALGDARDEAYLLGVLSSIPLDWYARRVVEIQVDFHVINAFPIPWPAREDGNRRRVEMVAARLAGIDDRYAAWAQAVGVEVGGVPDAEVEDALAALDASVALLYGLSADDLEHVFTTFHAGWQYRPRLETTLSHYRKFEREEEHEPGP